MEYIPPIEGEYFARWVQGELSRIVWVSREELEELFPPHRRMSDDAAQVR